jgi:hypothetical protein
MPVEAHATARADVRLACVIATVIPRSLNDPVGLWPSCFMSKRSTPAHALTAGRPSSGVFPSGWLTISSGCADGSTSSRYRHTPE